MTPKSNTEIKKPQKNTHSVSVETAPIKKDDVSNSSKHASKFSENNQRTNIAKPTTKVQHTVTVEKKKATKDSLTDVENMSSGSIQYGTGRRKNASARVWVKVGNGKITVNKKELSQYFPSEVHQSTVNKPFEMTNTLGQYDVICTVKGGGTNGQAGAIRHGIARALDKLVPDFHKILRSNELLTRDPRMVERKKYGRSGARKRYQFSKR